MKLSITKKTIKALSNDNKLLPQYATINIAGGRRINNSEPSVCTMNQIDTDHSGPTKCTAKQM